MSVRRLDVSKGNCSHIRFRIGRGVAEPVHMEQSYRELMLNEFLRRRSILITYTLKQYSKDLGLSYVHLQQILHSDKGLSKANAFRVGGAMGLNHSKALVFRYMVSAESGRSKAERTLAKQKLRNLKTKIRSS